MHDFLQFSQTDEVATKIAASVRYAGWHEIAAWARARGLQFDGNVDPLNRRRKAEGRRPFVLMPGPLRKGFR